jgi:signal recognition particle GTPase
VDIERLKKEYANKHHSETEIENMFKNGFIDYLFLGYVYKNEYYDKYTNLIKYHRKDFLMKLFKKTKINKINITDLSKENLEKIFITKNIKKDIVNKLFTYILKKFF